MTEESSKKEVSDEAERKNQRPSRWLQFALYYQRLQDINGTAGVFSNLEDAFEQFPDCKLFLGAFYASKDDKFEERSEVEVTAGELNDLINSWFHSSENIPLYGECVEFEVAKRTKLAINYTTFEVNLEYFKAGLRSVSLKFTCFHFNCDKIFLLS